MPTLANDKHRIRPTKQIRTVLTPDTPLSRMIQLPIILQRPRHPPLPSLNHRPHTPPSLSRLEIPTHGQDNQIPSLRLSWHPLPRTSSPLGYLNLFPLSRDAARIPELHTQQIPDIIMDSRRGGYTPLMGGICTLQMPRVTLLDLQDHIMVAYGHQAPNPPIHFNNNKGVFLWVSSYRAYDRMWL